jgi:hypothetical protein
MQRSLAASILPPVLSGEQQLQRAEWRQGSGGDAAPTTASCCKADIRSRIAAHHAAERTKQRSTGRWRWRRWRRQMWIWPGMAGAEPQPAALAAAAVAARAPTELLKWNL